VVEFLGKRAQTKVTTGEGGVRTGVWKDSKISREKKKSVLSVFLSKEKTKNTYLKSKADRWQKKFCQGKQTGLRGASTAGTLKKKCRKGKKKNNIERKNTEREGKGEWGENGGKRSLVEKTRWKAAKKKKVGHEIQKGGGEESKGSRGI